VLKYKDNMPFKGEKYNHGGEKNRQDNGEY
jgi:hypothetical protein